MKKDFRPRSVALLAAVCLLSSGAVAVQDDEGFERIGGTRSTLEQWIETRRLISEEKRDWALGKELLDDRIVLVQREIDRLRSGIAEAEASIAEADLKRADLIEQNEQLKGAAAALAEAVAALEARTKRLLQRLPEPVRERVEPLSQRIPENPENTEESLSERFQNVVGVLNGVNKFHREISVSNEVRSLPDGTSAEVAVLYVGISQAYYVSVEGKVAGVGTASEDAWVWAPANEAGEEIARTIAIMQNEEAAAFVRLPIEVE